MPYNSSFDIANCIPTEEDFREVAEAKVSNDKSRALGGFACIEDSEAPYYYSLVRRFFACLLLKWNEAAKACENLLLSCSNGMYTKATIANIVQMVRDRKDRFIDNYNKFPTKFYIKPKN